MLTRCRGLPLEQEVQTVLEIGHKFDHSICFKASSGIFAASPVLTEIFSGLYFSLTKAPGDNYIITVSQKCYSPPCKLGRMVDLTYLHEAFKFPDPKQSQSTLDCLQSIPLCALPRQSALEKPVMPVRL